MDARRQMPFRADDPDAFRQAVLRQVQELTADNQRLLQSVVKSEKRFRRLAKSVWHVQEEERRRLARELHDGIGQILTALANQLQRIHDDARAAENLGLGHRLADALEITRSALHDTRELSRLLRPTLLDDLGLEAALNWLARTLSERAGIAIQIRSTLGEQRLAPDVETLVYRITQEALTNVMRHSEASEVEILLACGANTLRLQVRDDGCGFDAAELGGPDRVGVSAGVRGMRDRAELFGGRLEISSVAGQGTSVQLTLPLDAEGAAAGA
ncbi:MAG TPA: sensor histidine kinase [Solimonas sp.]|nr:sensor histidine kinase [Solimonas sp.]